MGPFSIKIKNNRAVSSNGIAFNHCHNFCRRLCSVNEVPEKRNKQRNKKKPQNKLQPKMLFRLFVNYRNF